MFEDDADHPETVALYRPSWADFYSVVEARDRILRILGEGGDGWTLEHFLPDQLSVAEPGLPPEASFRIYSAWATTFSASLEMAKQGDVVLAQMEAFASVYFSRPTVSSLT